MKKKSTTKRREMSGERRIALALVEVIEGHNAIVANEPDASNRFQAALKSAEEVLITQGFAGLESITSRTAKIEAELQAAYKALDGKRVQELGRELDRASKGLPPLQKKVKAAAAGEGSKT